MVGGTWESGWRGDGGGWRGGGGGWRGKGRGNYHRRSTGNRRSPGGGFSRPHNNNSGRFIIGYRKLERWSEMESEQLANELYGNAAKFGEVINKPGLKKDWVTFAINILYKITQASGSSMKKRIFEGTFQTSTFWSQVVPNYLRQLSMFGTSTADRKLIALQFYWIIKLLLEINPAICTHITFSDLVVFARNVGSEEIERAVSKIFFIHNCEAEIHYHFIRMINNRNSRKTKAT